MISSQVRKESKQRAAELSRQGVRFTAPFLAWDRPIDPEKAAERVSRGRSVDAWVEETSCRMKDSGDLDEVHVLYGPGRPEQLEDADLARTLKHHRGTWLRTSDGKTDKYSLYNTLTGQKKGDVLKDEREIDRDFVLAHGYFRGDVEADVLLDPSRARSMQRIVESGYGAGDGFLLAERYHQGEDVHFGSTLTKYSKAVPSSSAEFPLSLDPSVLENEENVSLTLQNLARVRDMERRIFELGKNEESKADLILASTLWKTPTFDLEGLESLMRRCAEWDDGRDYLYRLIHDKKLPSRERVEGFFQNIETYGPKKPMSFEIQDWLKEKPWNRESLELARGIGPADTPARDLLPLAETIASSERKPEEIRQVVSSLRRQARPVTPEALSLALEVKPSLLQAVMEVYVESRESPEQLRELRGQKFPLTELFSQANTDADDWSTRFNQLREHGLSPIPSAYAALGLDGKELSEEELKTAQFMAPNRWRSMPAYTRALSFSQTLAPEDREAFVAAFPGRHVGGWENQKEALFPGGKRADWAFKKLQAKRRKFGTPSTSFLPRLERFQEVRPLRFTEESPKPAPGL